MLKAGGAYVPIDPNWPSERFKHILNDTKSPLLLAQSHLIDRFLSCITNRDNYQSYHDKNDNLPSTELTVIPTHNKKYSTSPDNTLITDDDLAYIMYTSGTTGQPKGVIQTHCNVVSILTIFLAQQEIDFDDVWMLAHPYVFDVSVWEIFGALFCGGQLIIPTSQQAKNADYLYELCYDKNITLFTQTSSALSVFIDVALDKFDKRPLLNMKYIFFGGEVLNRTKLQAWYKRYKNCGPTFINMYGTTETTFTTLTYEVSPTKVCTNCIGRVLDGQSVYVIDQYFTPIPIGAVGELCIRGRLAKGYLSQPELTREKFVDNPFLTQTANVSPSTNKLYKTGDWVRLLVDGSLQFIGRHDDQIKIRGHRIELSEIVNQLLLHPDIDQATVSISREGNSTILVAYCVTDCMIKIEILRSYLAQHLPFYMIPQIIMHVKCLPLTINGKLDRKALPIPPLLVDINAYVAPSSKKEKIICENFSKVLNLNVQEVSVEADFFDIGGNSLNVINLVFILRKHFEVNINTIFEMRTPRQLASILPVTTKSIHEHLQNVAQIIKQKPIKNTVVNRPDNDQISITKKLSIRLKPIKTVLLTGATGFLGCNLLHQLLLTTNYQIVLLVRGTSLEETKLRLNKLFYYYFERHLDDFNNRIEVLLSDLEQPDLALSVSDYRRLTKRVDSIIHSAALVKHYGEYDVFYSANVQATINILTFSKKTQLKDFHYMSTYSIIPPIENKLLNGEISYTENYLPKEEDIDKQINLYNKTKLQGELAVVAFRKKGVDGYIYRLGNLAFIADKMKLQNNIADNAFFNWLQCLLKIGCTPEQFAKVELSPVDEVAKAVVKLFDKTGFSSDSHVFHVFNPKLFDLVKALEKSTTSSIRVVDIKHFVDRLLTYHSMSLYQNLIARFCIRQGWLDNNMIHCAFTVSQDITEGILKSLGFHWKAVSHRCFKNYLVAIEPETDTNLFSIN